MKTVFTIFVLLLNLYLIGQNTIPNPNFEQWTSGNPNGWQTSNSFTQQFGATTVSQEAVNPYQGSFAVKLETKSVFGYSIAGLITNGQISVNVNQSPPVTILGGTPFTARPNRFKGFFKYVPSGNDFCQVVAILLKYNANSNVFDTIAVAQFLNTATINSWTLFDVPFNYVLGDTPDTIQVVAISSNPNASVTGSVLYLDSLHFEGGSLEIQNTYNSEQIIVSYNPFNQMLVIQYHGISDNAGIAVFDILGNKVYETKIPSVTNFFTIPTHRWTKGMYLVRVQSQKNISGKVIVY